MKTLRHLIKIISTFLLFILLFKTSPAQTNENIKLLKLKIQSADSVIIIGHQLTGNYGPSDELFIVKGKINRKIIKESLPLTTEKKNNLTKILLRPVMLNLTEGASCDLPRHSIIIYKNSNESYIDICFGCRKIHASKDITFDEFNMDNKKWKDLENFFLSNGLTKMFKRR